MTRPEMNYSHASTILEGVRERLTEMPVLPVGNGVSLAGTSAEPAEAGSGVSTPAYSIGAVNLPDVGETFRLYIASLIHALVEKFAMSADDAEGFVFGVIGDLEDQGVLPMWPEGGDASAEFQAAWLGHAKTAGLHYEIIKRAGEG